jgi:predicted transcriptional regulator
MAYSQKTIDAIMRAPKTSGNQLGRWAAHHNFSVVRISKALGVSRQTVYNWFEGGDIFPAYEHRVETLLKFLQNSHSADEAWRKICQHYNLVP